MSNQDTRGFLWKTCDDTTAKDRKNMKRYASWMALWAISFVTASQLIKRELLPEGPYEFILGGVSVLISLGVLLSFTRYLRDADELQRLLHLKAMSLAFGITLFSLYACRLAERMGVFELALGDFSVFMLFSYVVSFLWCRRSHR